MLLHANHETEASDTLASVENSDRIDEALNAVKADLRSGRTHSIEHYGRQFPEVADVLCEVVPSVIALEQVRARQLDEAHTKLAPRKICAYEICGELGRGGMAVVYEAQDTKLARKVALKVLPYSSGLHPMSVLRFQHEAQVLAQLDHPHIVPVYDFGEHEGSRFLAMKLIEGIPLDEVVPVANQCSHVTDRPGERALPDAPTIIEGIGASVIDSTTPRPPATQAAFERLIPSDRIESLRFVTSLCIDVARALHAAHECGVVHRDIKPSNLMLDHDGHVWVTDFGLALTRGHETMTRTGDLLGTVRYMSPEQSRGSRSLVDARSDVYSLGITLYELTTGHAAFEGEAHEILYRIESEELSQPCRWDPDFPRDLQNIILKATAKSPERRYETAAEMADDLARFLTGEATIACAPTLTERASRWISRRRRTVGVMIGFAALLLGGSLLTTAMVYHEMTKTEAALELAEVNFHETQQVVDRFGLQLDSELALIDGSEHIRRRVLNDVIEHYRSFIARSRKTSGLTEDLALTLNKVAALTEHLGTPEEALAAHIEAWRAFDGLAASDPGNPVWSVNLALCDNSIGMLYAGSGNFSAAEERFLAAKTALEDLIRTDSTDVTSRRALGQTLNNIGLMHIEQNAVNLAIASFTEAQSILGAIVTANSHEEIAQRYLAATFENLASANRTVSPRKAREAHAEAIRLQTQLIATHPDRVDYRQELAISYDSFGVLLTSIKDQSAAASAFSNAAEIQRELLKSSPGSAVVLRQLAWSNNRLGQAFARLGRVPDAIHALRASLKIQQQVCNITADYAPDVETLGGIWNNLGFAYEGDGNLVAATSAYRTAVEKLNDSFEIARASESQRVALDRAYVNLARMLNQHGDSQEALAVLARRHQLNRIVPSRGVPPAGG